MRKLICVLILGALIFAPVKRLDIAKLEPVEAIALWMEDGLVKLKTDTEAVGVGQTLVEAVENLKESASSVVYLDTAKYMLVAEGAENQMEQLLEYLKNGIKIGEYAGGDVKNEAKYLEIHEDIGDVAKNNEKRQK